MKLTIRQKALAGTLLLAGLAFGIDRIFWSAPTAASAQPLPVVPGNAQAPKKNPPSPAHVDHADALLDLSSISERLQESADGLSEPNVKDAFAPSAAWLERTTDKLRKLAPTSAEVFRGKHRLMAILLGGRGAIVIVDGKTVAAGESVDGFQLKSVSDVSAIFENDQGKVELKLAGSPKALSSGVSGENPKTQIQIKSE